MADKKYQIFISSTYQDLIEERNEVSKAVLDLGHIPAGMELFPAADVEQLDYIKQVIDECDYYVLILGGRYGSEDADGVSYTEREYEYALATGKTVLAFVHENPDTVEVGKTDKDPEKERKLAAFRGRVMDGRLIKTWKNASDLKAEAVTTLSRAFRQSPQVGWVRGDTVPDNATISDLLTARAEIEKLRKELEKEKELNEPLFEDAASLETQFTQNYRYSDGYGFLDGSVTMSFADWFALAAPALMHGGSVETVIGAIKTGLKDRYDVPRASLSVNQSDVQQALLHLVATGHVRLMSSTAKPYNLSERGTQFWLQNSYVKDGNAKSEGNE